MTRRYTYTTNIEIQVDEGGGPEYEVKVSFTFTPGAPETPPAYSHGGLPADDAEIDDVRLETVNGKPRPWGMYDGYIADEDAEFERVVVQILTDSGESNRHIEAMFAEVADADAADHDAAMEARRDG